MNYPLLDPFIVRSNAVGNTTLVLTPDECQAYCAGHTTSDSFVYLPTFGEFATDVPIPQSGISSALIEARHGISATGTVVVESQDERLRLASCLAEELIVVLPITALVATLYDLAGYMEAITANPNAFIAFISGPSRTADIERVLTIGVHGPGAMTVLLVKE